MHTFLIILQRFCFTLFCITLMGCTAQLSLQSVLDKIPSQPETPSTPPDESENPSLPSLQSLGVSSKIVDFGFVGHEALRAPSFTHPTALRNFYVDPANGNDANSGLSPATAWKSLVQAGAQAQPGDHVHLMDGIFRETLAPLNSGTENAPIVFKAMTGNTPILKGSNIVSDLIPLGAVETGGLLIGSAETNDLSEFPNASVHASNTLTTTTSQKHAGSYAFQFSYGGTAGDARLAKNFTAEANVYARMYFKLDPQFELGADGDYQRIFMLRNQPYNKNLLSLLLTRNGANYEVLAYYSNGTEDGTLIPLTNPQIPKNQWVSLEIHYLGGSSSAGTAEVWINDILVGSATNLNTNNCNGGASPCTVTRVEVGTPSGTTKLPVADSKFWADNIRLATSKNGSTLHTGSPGIFKKAGLNSTPHLAFVDGTYYPSATNLLPGFATEYTQDAAATLATLPEGSYFYDSPAKTLYLRMPGNADPRLHLVEVGARSEIISLNGKSYLTFQNLTLQHANKDNAGAITLLESHNIRILENSIRDNFGAGVLIRAASHDNLVSKNQFWDNKKEFGSGVRIDMQSHHNTVEYNTVSTTVDFEAISTSTAGVPSDFNYTDHLGGSAFFFRYDGDSSRPEFYGPPHHNIVRFNRAHNLVDSAVYMADQVQDNEVHSNIFSNLYAARPWGSSGGNGVHIAKSSTGNKIYNNIIYNVDTSAINLRYGAGDNAIYNNTLFNAGRKSSWYSSNSSLIAVVGPTSSAPTAPASFNNKIFNNILHSAAGYCFDVDTESAAVGTNSLNHNICHNPSGLGPYRWGGQAYASLASLQTASSQELQGLQADPLLTSTSSTTPDFKLAEGSPAAGMATSPSPLPQPSLPTDNLDGSAPSAPIPPPQDSSPSGPPPDEGTTADADELSLQMSTSPFDLGTTAAYFSKDISYGPHSRNVFDIFLPKSAWDSKSATSLVIFIHGGGFTQGNKEDAYGKKALIKSLLDAGVAFASINYPLLDGTHTNGVMDSLNGSKRALQFMRYHAASLNILPGKIILMGSSAGASTSLWLALHDDLKNTSSTDEVEKQSTRVLAAVASETQATLDVVQWETIFSQYNLSVSSMSSSVKNLYSISSLDALYSEPMVSYRANINIPALMDASDPEIWVSNTEINNVAPTTSSILFHHPLHAKTLKDAASSAGLPGVFQIPKLGITTSSESNVDFILRKFSSAP